MKYCCCIFRSAIVLLLVVYVVFIILRSHFDITHIQSFAELGSFLVALSGGLYAIHQYSNHLEEEKRKVLCEYNQRYSSDKNIEKVVEWMLLIAKTDEKTGEIIGVNDEVKSISPGIYKKELFMRFFEEINLRIEKGDMNADEVYKLFAYYAMKFDNHPDFRSDIIDYKNESELKALSKSERNIFKDHWVDFRSFIEKMKNVEKKINK